MSQIFYGDHSRWFIGLVIDVNDPLKLDRVKVRIQGIHTPDTTLIPNADLPWAQVAIPVTEGGSSGLGANSSLKPRAQVYGIFLDGRNSQLPLVIGSIPKIETYANQSGDADPSYPSFNKKSGIGNIDLDLDGNTNIEKAFKINQLQMINSGLIIMKRNIIDLEKIEEILSNKIFMSWTENRFWVTEQTIYAMLAAQNGVKCNVLPEIFDVSIPANLSNEAMHFVGKIRKTYYQGLLC